MHILAWYFLQLNMSWQTPFFFQSVHIGRCINLQWFLLHPLSVQLLHIVKWLFLCKHRSPRSHSPSFIHWGQRVKCWKLHLFHFEHFPNFLKNLQTYFDLCYLLGNFFAFLPVIFFGMWCFRLHKASLQFHLYSLQLRSPSLWAFIQFFLLHDFP